jgi:hypothetical protein
VKTRSSNFFWPASDSIGQHEQKTKEAPAKKMAFVLDGSVTMVWAFEDETDSYAEAVAGVIVAYIWDDGSPTAEETMGERNQPEALKTLDVVRDGPYLLVRLGADLPTRCIKTNAHETVMVEQTATNLHVRLLGMALFGGLVAGFVPDGPIEVKFGCLGVAVLGTLIGMVLHPRVRLRLPVCPAIARRRQFLLVVGWSLFALAMGVYALAMLLPPEQLPSVQHCMLAALGLMGAGVTALYFAPFLGVEFVEEGFARLTGAGPSYLASLPQAPHRLVGGFVLDP